MSPDDERFTAINDEAWAAGDYVDAYATRDLHPAEIVLLVRYAKQLSGRVLELGCGAGRLLGYLAEFAQAAHGVDISEAMVARCHAGYPSARVTVGSLTEPATWPAGRFDQIWMARNLIDVLEDDRRSRLLDQLRVRLNPGGVLIFSSHNLDSVGHDRQLGWVRRIAWTPPITQLRDWRRAAVRRRNRRALGPRAYEGPGYAVINDDAQDYALLHYYVRRDDQAAQLEAHGWELLECVDLAGRPVGRGEVSRSPDLHDVATPRRESM
jgi:SAM-dependent methyltransferase